MSDKFEFSKIDEIPEEYKEYSEAYKYSLNDKDIGYAYVNLNSHNNSFYLRIDDDYQSNGYGTKLYSEVTNLFKKAKIDSLKLEVDDDNIRMNRIISHYPRMVIHHVEGRTTYLVKVK